MCNKKVMKSNVKNLIALCNILDEYAKFKGILSNSPVKYNNDIYKLNKISNKKFVFGSKKIKIFYEENREIIDKINTYSNIVDFLCYSEEKSNFDLFYEYILSHKEELNKITSVLNVIKILGFKELELDESVDFANTKYKVDAKFERNITIPYLDNIQIIPNYQDGIIEYTTTDSNYLINIWLSHEDYLETERNIIVNSLTFDSKNLPKSISNKKLFKKLCILKEKQKDKCTAIKNSVDLSASIDDLCSQFDTTDKAIKKLSGVQNKSNIINILNEIKESLNELRTESIYYNKNISKEYPNLTEEKLETAKQKKKNRLYWSKVNID